MKKFRSTKFETFLCISVNNSLLIYFIIWTTWYSKQIRWYIKTGIERSWNSLEFFPLNKSKGIEFKIMMNESSPIMPLFMFLRGTSQNIFPIVTLYLNAILTLWPPQSWPGWCLQMEESCVEREEKEGGKEGRKKGSKRKEEGRERQKGRQRERKHEKINEKGRIKV